MCMYCICSMKCVNGSFTHYKAADCWSIICQSKKTALTDANLVFPDPFFMWLYEYHQKQWWIFVCNHCVKRNYSQNYNQMAHLISLTELDLLQFVWPVIYSLATNCWAPQAFYLPTKTSDWRFNLHSPALIPSDWLFTETATHGPTCCRWQHGAFQLHFDGFDTHSSGHQNR